MAEFCKDCSIRMFGKDYGDFEKLLHPAAYSPEVGALVLCECCGPIVVDIEGKRMSTDFHPDCECAAYQEPII